MQYGQAGEVDPSAGLTGGLCLLEKEPDLQGYSPSLAHIALGYVNVLPVPVKPRRDRSPVTHVLVPMPGSTQLLKCDLMFPSFALRRNTVPLLAKVHIRALSNGGAFSVCGFGYQSIMPME